MDVHDNNPIVIAPGTGGTGGGDAASSGRQFDPAWTKEKEFLDRTLPARIMCPRCQTIWASGSEYWGHHLFTHWEEDKVTNFLCTVSSRSGSNFSGLATGAAMFIISLFTNRNFVLYITGKSGETLMWFFLKLKKKKKKNVYEPDFTRTLT